MNKFKVLSLAGGGILGYSQATMLANFEKESKESLSRKFHLIAGTSIGSINGAALASNITASTVKQFFKEWGPKIFERSIKNEVQCIYKPLYTAEIIEQALQSLFSNKQLKDCKVPFIAVSYDYATDRPVYFKSYEKSYEDDNFVVIGYDSGIYLWEVCRSSAAAQVYFPAHEYNDMVLLDGGNTGDNSPDMLLIAEASEFTQIKNIKMLSIGTGNSNWNAQSKKMISPGALRAGINTIEIVFSAGVDAQVYKAKKILKENHTHISAKYQEDIKLDQVSKLHEIEKAANSAYLFNQDKFKEF